MDPVAAYNWIVSYRHSDPHLAFDAAEALLNRLIETSGRCWPADAGVTVREAENLAKRVIADLKGRVK